MSVYGFAHERAVPAEPAEGARSPGAGITSAVGHDVQAGTKFSAVLCR